MTSRSKEKVAAAFRKLFRSSEKLRASSGAGGGGAGATGAGQSSTTTSDTGDPDAVASAETSTSAAACSKRLGSPGGARLLRCRDAVAPASVPVSPRGRGARIAPDKKTRSAERSAIPPEVISSVICSANRSVRARRLMKELRELQRLQRCDVSLPFTVELVDDSLFEWHVRLHRVDADSDLARDMQELDVPHILLHLSFPENFPFAPPFMRVISPRIEKGFVMEGGAICMELLTPRGWASAYTVEAVLMQFAASLVKGQGRIARSKNGTKDFNKRSAEQSFRSLIKTHDKYGWVTPALADG